VLLYRAPALRISRGVARGRRGGCSGGWIRQAIRIETDICQEPYAPQGAPRQGCSLLNCTTALYRDCVNSNIGQSEILAHTSNHGWLKVLGERKNGRIREQVTHQARQQETSQAVSEARRREAPKAVTPLQSALLFQPTGRSRATCTSAPTPDYRL